VVASTSTVPALTSNPQTVISQLQTPHPKSNTFSIHRVPHTVNPVPQRLIPPLAFDCQNLTIRKRVSPCLPAGPSYPGEQRPQTKPCTTLSHRTCLQIRSCKSQFPHTLDNSSCIITNIKNKLTDLCGNKLWANDFINTVCEIKATKQAQQGGAAAAGP